MIFQLLIIKKFNAQLKGFKENTQLFIPHKKLFTYLHILILLMKLWFYVNIGKTN